MSDEFEDYVESVYEPEADYESLSDELLQWEYERFLEMMENSACWRFFTQF